MKVLYFTRGQTPHDLRFTKALAETSHKVFVLCLDADQRRKWPGGVYEVAWQGINMRLGWLAASARLGRLKTVFETLKPDLVHAGPIQSTAWLTALAGFHPLVSMSWGSDLMFEADRSESARRITRFTLARSDVLVGDCACVGQKAQSFGFDLARYRQFPWGVDLKHFAPAVSTRLREKLGWVGKTVLLSTRSFEPIYGVDVLINAFALAARQNPDLRLLLLGHGSHEKRLAALVKQLDLQQKVHFYGTATVEELPDLYHSADFYLSASHSDGSSVSLMEALACGLPVIVSDIPGNLEWVTEGEQGWLFKDGDAEGFSHKILLAVAQGSALAAMKKGNRFLAKKRADWKKNFAVLLEAYELASQKGNAHA